MCTNTNRREENVLVACCHFSKHYRFLNAFSVENTMDNQIDDKKILFQFDIRTPKDGLH